MAKKAQPSTRVLDLVDDTTCRIVKEFVGWHGQVVPETKLGDLFFDDLDGFEVSCKLADHFHLKVDLEPRIAKLTDNDTVGKIADLVREAMKS